jgi:hypothetical protein
MKKEKAYRLDSILEVLVVNRYLTKTEIETKLEESVIYSVYSGHIDPPFRLIDPLARGNIPEGQPKNGIQ